MKTNEKKSRNLFINTNVELIKYIVKTVKTVKTHMNFKTAMNKKSRNIFINTNVELIKYVVKTVKTHMNFRTAMKKINQIRNYRLTNLKRKVSTNTEIMIKN